MSFMSQLILTCTNEICPAVLIMCGVKAHFYIGRYACKHMMDGNPVPQNKEFPAVTGAVHTGLYDGGVTDAIPFDNPEDFFRRNLK